MTDSTPDCFALLDDCDSSAADPRSRLYCDHVATLACHDPGELPAMFGRMQQALAQGLHAVGLFSYELGARMQGIELQSDPPVLAQVLLFGRCDRLSAEQVIEWLAERTPHPQCAGVAAMHCDIGEQEFNAAIARIQDYIERGDTYQVNYTCRMRFQAYGSPLALYRRLRERQPVPYGALIRLPDGGTVLSLSPELFVRHEQGIMTARPMKGTAPATGDARQDAKIAAGLAADAKNRAENVMIVDLLRNDLGRVAACGSVRVPRLFHVERYGEVLQMTSTVTADLRNDVDLAQVFAALYPCGSITGAPKYRTMQIIGELETGPRGVYTGAIGWFDSASAGRNIGDFCLSVPIRTLVLQPPQGGVCNGEMGVGAGIVHDSRASDEFAECRLKARFLTGLPEDFELIETMLATREQGGRYLDLHCQRLQASARYFGFRHDDDAIRNRVTHACLDMEQGRPYRLRLALNEQGVVTIQTAPLAPLQNPVRVLLSDEPTDADDVFLRHKTTVRERYDAAWRAAEAQGAFDIIFCNQYGELTEGARSNLFIKLDGRWYTPPLSAGVLPGVMRTVLLADREWAAQERSLTVDDLLHAQEVVVCNSLRGALSAVSLVSVRR